MTENLGLDQIKQVNALIDEAMALVNDGDRVPFFLQADRTFLQDSPAAVELVFNVPSDADFFGVRLNLYPEARTISVPQPQVETDLAFRPIAWTCEADIGAYGTLTFPIAPDAINALFEIRTDEGAYQTLPISMQGAFSARHGLSSLWMDRRAGPLVSVYKGGLDFAVDEWVRRGNTVTVKVTPVFVRRPQSAEEKQEYRIRGVLTGYKRAKPFKGESYPLTLVR